MGKGSNKKSKPSSTQGGTIKVGKYRRQDIQKTLSEGSKPAPKRKGQAASNEYDDALLSLAERQIGKSTTNQRHSSKPLMIAPPTLVLPSQPKEQAFEQIDQMIAAEQSINTTVASNVVTKAKPRKADVSINRFSGLSDSEEDDESAVAKFKVQPATFVWNPSS